MVQEVQLVQVVPRGELEPVMASVLLQVLALSAWLLLSAWALEVVVSPVRGQWLPRGALVEAL